MRILQVMAGNSHGGAETAFVDTCIAFKQAGQNIEIVTRPNDVRVPALQNAGLKVHLLPFGGKVDIFTTWRIKKIIKQFKPDIIQTWMSRGSEKTPPWTPAMKIPRYLVVPRLGGYYKIKYFKSADYFTTITPDIKTHLVKSGIAEDHITHINNFAETEDIKTPIQRSDLQTPDNAPLLLALGRLHEAKAHDTLIKAVAGLSGVYCWIAGEGPLRRELEELIRTLGVEDRVKLLGWRSDRAALLQACDICTFCSRFEPFGTVFVQAWAQQTPVIVTKADGPRQFVRDHEDALLIDIDDISSLQNAVLELIQDRNLTKTLTQNGLQRYQNEFSKDKTCQAYFDYFRAIRSREGLTTD